MMDADKSSNQSKRPREKEASSEPELVDIAGYEAADEKDNDEQVDLDSGISLLKRVKLDPSHQTDKLKASNFPATSLKIGTSEQPALVLDNPYFDQSTDEPDQNAVDLKTETGSDSVATPSELNSQGTPPPTSDLGVTEEHFSNNPSEDPGKKS